MTKWVLCGTLVMTVLAALALTGCGGEKAAEQIAETAIKANLGEDAENVDIDIDSESESFSMSIRGEQGGMNVAAGENAKLPDNFPEDVPLYPGTKLQVVSTMADNNMFMVQGSTPDAADKVIAHLGKEASAKGWSESMSMNMGAGQRMINYEKDNRILHFMIVREDNLTQVSVTTGTQ